MRIIQTIFKEFNYNNHIYQVVITYKAGKRNITYRFKDEKFLISSPITARYKTIEEGLIKFAPRLLKSYSKPVLFGEDFIYLLGDRYEIKNNVIMISDDKHLKFDSVEELKKQLKKWFLKIVQQQVEAYKTQMGISEHLTVHVKEMKSRYGSFSKRTNGLSFGFELIHYDIEMLKAVVVHELSHYYVFDHSKRFYDLVLKNYPNYYEVHGKLRKGIVR